MNLSLSAEGSLPENSQAADTKNEPSVITVTGTRRKGYLKDSTVTTEVISRKQIDEMGARDLSDTLGNVPGIEVRPAAPGERGETVRLQGLSGQNVLILVDGQRTTGRFSGSVDLTRFKAEDIERIEIVKGASSALYGSDAMAGVINIITKEAKGPVSVDFRTLGGGGSPLYYGPTNEFRNYGSMGIRKENLSTIFTVGWHKGGGYDLTVDATPGPTSGRYSSLSPTYNTFPSNIGLLNSYYIGTRFPSYQPPLESTTGSAFNDMNVSNKTVYRFAENLILTTGVFYRYLDQSAVDSALPRTTYDRRNKTSDFMISSNLDWELSKKWNFNLNANHSNFFDTFITDQRRADDLDTKQTTNNSVSELRKRIDYKFSENHITSVGVETLYDRLSSARIAPDCKRNFPNFCIDDFNPDLTKKQTVNGNADRYRNAFFVQDEWRISDAPRIQIVPGIRYDVDSIYGGQWLPKLAVRYDITDQFRIRAANGLGYRAPSFQDLYFNFVNPGVGYRVAGNPNLRPEFSRSYNLGAEWDLTKRIWISSNLFYNQIDNLIGFRTNPGIDTSGLLVFQTANYAKAKTQGIESSINIKLNEVVGIGGGFTYTDTKDELTNLPLEGRGPHRWNVNLKLENKSSGSSLTVFGIVFGKQPYYCIKNPFWCNPDFDDSLSGVGLFLQSLSERNIDLFFNDVPEAVSLYCSERNNSFCTREQTFGVRMRNAYTQLNLKFNQKFFEQFAWFVGVDNLLDEWDVRFNPQRPRFIYFGLDGNFTFSENHSSN